MRHLIIAIALLLAACASTKNANVPPPDVDLVQLYGPSDLSYSRGQSSVMAKYQVQVKNNAAEPITLRRVELQTVSGGTVYLRTEDRAYNVQIPSGETRAVEMNARVYFTTSGSGSPSNEPLSLRAIAYFESASGPFRKIIIRNIGQFPSGG